MDNINTNIKTVLGRLNGAYAPNTLKSYYADARAFVDWCAERNIKPFPIASQTLCAYIEYLQGDSAYSTIRRRIASLRRLNKMLGFEDQTRTEEVYLAIRRLKRSKCMIRKSKTDQYGRGRLVFGSERSAKLVRKWLRLKPQEIQPVFCAINHGKCEDRAICGRNVNDIIKRGVVKVKRCERPSDLEVSGHSLRVGAAQDLLIKGYDLAAIMRAGGWSDPSTVSWYLRFSQHNIWNVSSSTNVKFH